MIRKPVVANQFYPGNPLSLLNMVKKFAIVTENKQDAIAVVSPHAGYIYSGEVAGMTFANVNIPETVIILCPNHTGYGEKVSVMAAGNWEIPIGNIPVESEIAKELITLSPIISDDSMSHKYEHSIEVQLPFLYFFQKNISIVPISVMHLSYTECEQVAEALVTTIKKKSKKILLVASSDMNHYESHETTLKKDQIAIDALLNLNPQKLYNEVMKNDISMCGVVPSTIALAAALKLGAKNAKLIAHKTSGDVNKDFSHVVGYAGIIIN